MLFRRARSSTLLSMILTSALVLAAGCSKQGEGERCSTDNGNADCADGLECTSSKKLLGPADICCPTSGGSNDPACIPGGLGGTGGGGGTGGSISTGGGGTGGTGGSGGTGGTGTGGSGGTGGTGGSGGSGGN